MLKNIKELLRGVDNIQLGFHLSSEQTPLNGVVFITDFDIRSISCNQAEGNPEQHSGLEFRMAVIALEKDEELKNTAAIVRILLKYAAVTPYVISHEALKIGDIEELATKLSNARQGVFWLTGEILKNYKPGNDLNNQAIVDQLIQLSKLIKTPLDKEDYIELLKSKLKKSKPAVREMLKKPQAGGSFHKKVELTQEEVDRCENFFSYKTFVNEAAIVGDKFYLESIGKEKFFIKVDAQDEDEQEAYYRYIVKNKHIAGLNRIDYLGDIGIDSSEYKADLSTGLITVRIRGIEEDLQDNKLIEEFLEDRFGPYKQFIKEWLAVYSYTNYQTLPILILTGERGCGKNTFAESIAEIFSTLSSTVKELEGSFNPEAEQKLIIIDESESSGKLQYQTLKGISGQKKRRVNKKYTPQYDVRNNLNVIFLSNELLPITVDRDELPIDEANNQFFVLRMPEFKGRIDNMLQSKITARLGHYIRTELKAVFEGLSFEGFRYSIRVPITEDEKKLFSNSVSEVEAEADRVIDHFESDIANSSWYYYSYVEAGYIPTEYFEDVLDTRKALKMKVIQNLKKRKYLEDGATVRCQVGNDRKYCQRLGKVWLDEVNKIKNQTPPKKVAVSPFQDSHSDGHLRRLTDTDQLEMAV